MDNLAIISIILGFIGLVSSFFLEIFFIRGLKKLEELSKSFKEFVFFLPICSSLAVIGIILAIFLRAFEVDHNNKIWILVPIVEIIAGTTFLIVGKRLIDIVRNIQEQTSKKLDIPKEKIEESKP